MECEEYEKDCVDFMNTEDTENNADLTFDVAGLFGVDNAVGMDGENGVDHADCINATWRLPFGLLRNIEL